MQQCVERASISENAGFLCRRVLSLFFHLGWLWIEFFFVVVKIDTYITFSRCSEKDGIYQFEKARIISLPKNLNLFELARFNNTVFVTN